ncbi:integrase catalytic domain-containing protein [Nephila pilipes]|uniref:Integrase catalytic domain-containing protein n=1 Tax=Nephila pilipes TaxID=299642 RepID=A0A8X6NPL8_NEPPI|nr:integrase catalytic domain-containing protein [Nephila pilipes]
MTKGLADESSFYLPQNAVVREDKYRDLFPETCETILKSFWIDDLVGGTEQVETALKITTETEEIFKNSGMVLRKWQTKLREAWRRSSIQTQKGETIEAGCGALTKIPGLAWDPDKDMIFFGFSKLIKILANGYSTNRFILQILVCIFDPIGFLRPFIISLKILLQELRAAEIDWDNKLPFLLDCKGQLVAPLKSLTLPRLELLGCLLSARLSKQLSFVIAQRALNKNIIGNSVLPMARKYIEQGYCNHIDENFTMLNNYIPNSVTPNVLSKNGLSKNIEIETYQEYLLPSIVQYDATIAGFERRPILELNCKEKDSQTLVAFKNGTCIGYGSIKRSCLGAGRVGPLFADDPVVAEALLKKLLESFPDRKRFAMMTLRDNITANSFIRKLGNPEIITCVRIYSKEKIKVDTNRIFALTDMSFSAV